MSTRPGISYERLGRNLSPGHVRGGVSGLGVAGAPHVTDAQPAYVKADCEQVDSDRNGCYFVKGRDRPTHRLSGYGGKGETGCAMMEMTVGRASVDNIGAVDLEGNRLYVDPSPEKDAAKIYISQKADIDDYWGCRPGSMGMSIARSAIGMKADRVVLVGREGIKLITRGDPRNSQGGLIEHVWGIDLIAGNDDTDLQPLVKGRNLISALDAIVQWIGKMNAVVATINSQQQAVFTALARHTHVPPLPPLMGAPTGPPDPIFMASMGIAQYRSTIDGTISLMGHRVNGEFLKMGYLNPSGRKFILSGHNNTN